LAWAIGIPARADSPGDLGLPLGLGGEQPEGFVALSGWVHRDPAVFESARIVRQGESLELTELYSQKHRLDIAISPLADQMLKLEIPFRYTFSLLEKGPTGNGWTFGDARVYWEGLWLAHSGFRLRWMGGVSLPVSTSAEGVFFLDDLESIPRNGRIRLSQGVDGAEGLRLILGWTQEWKPARETWSWLTLRSQLDIRQPLGNGRDKPPTLWDWSVASLSELSAWGHFVLSGGQTRAWFPYGFFEATAPSATYLQAAIDLEWGSPFGLSLGGRWNPLWEEEYTPYGLEDKGRVWDVHALVEPQARLFTRIVFHWDKPKAAATQPAKAVHSWIPTRDQDGDGIPDAEDACPTEAEDKDGYEDQDGCIDGDNDRDGIPDSSDLCPNDGEDRDGFADDDGCPDLDNDRDGIPDSHDQCPNEAEIINFYQDEDGCPDERPARIESGDLDGVNFDFESSVLSPEYQALWKDLAHRLKVYPGTGITLIGHADKRESNGRSLSKSRAMAVAKELAEAGVEPDRITVQGIGAERPLNSGRNAASRRQNRRIELLVR